ncbi:MAG TPA: IS200/IS605 family transposase [Tepidisphaeraceae bacterium]|jgi:REP element-mobilizing transposase RayT|nr:IS200/IS605 family transposase [Tepidisphaeraceae bacterium]
MAHTYANLLTHVIFSTKDRSGIIDADLGLLLFPYMGGIVRELNGTALAINGPTDHVHLLLALPANLALSEAMRVLKTNSSRWVHEQWPQRRTFAWQTGCGAFSVSQSNAEQVCAYIANQEEHHRQVSFQERFWRF